jgi:hypothetical protein
MATRKKFTKAALANVQAEVVELAQQDDGLLFAHVKFYATPMDVAPVAEETFHVQVDPARSVRRPVLHPNGRWIQRQDGGWDQVWIEVDGEWKPRVADPDVHVLEEVIVPAEDPLVKLRQSIRLWQDHIVQFPDEHVPDFGNFRRQNQGIARNILVRQLLNQRLQKDQ